MANPLATTLFLSPPRVGSGAYSDVYRARRLSDDAVVALNEVHDYQSTPRSAAENDLSRTSPSSSDPTPSSLRWRHELLQNADRPATTRWTRNGGQHAGDALVCRPRHSLTLCFPLSRAHESPAMAFGTVQSSPLPQLKKLSKPARRRFRRICRRDRAMMAPSNLRHSRPQIMTAIKNAYRGDLNRDRKSPIFFALN
ncbi:hypothetical protein L484_016480 [Morus notabilis]|uniref:Uncharacterized protein n=1 Tax=Morus notabilis TaxID=981085 RepID=W9QR90_9ROSA|nr:hypothetical protein L484_016480 [Morus notabilis]